MICAGWRRVVHRAGAAAAMARRAIRRAPPSRKACGRKMEEPVEPQIGFDDFRRMDVRVGTVLEPELFPEARKPAIKLVIDFGPAIGRRKSSAQLTKHYRPQELLGRQVAAALNFPPRQIGPMR